MSSDPPHDNLCGRLNVLLSLYDLLVEFRLVVHGHRGLLDGAQRRTDGLKEASPPCQKNTKILLYAKKINIMSELAHEVPASPCQQFLFAPCQLPMDQANSRGKGRELHDLVSAVCLFTKVAACAT